MSEFKFACPVCGQHITADSSSSGGHLECPTCFQKIVVPQAPADADSKLILSASQVGKPRPTSVPGGLETAPVSTSKVSLLPTLGLVLILVCGGGALYFFRDKVFKPTPKAPPPTTTQVPLLKQAYPIPTNFVWSLDLTNAAFPDTTASGSIHGEGFRCERAVLQGGSLTLRQGKANPPELLIQLRFAARQGEDLAGKVIQIAPERLPPLPLLTLQWKDELQHPARRNFKSGYALKIVFGQPASGRMPGRLFVCLPDAEKSFVAGTFEAELRKPAPPKPKVPKPAPGSPPPGAPLPPKP